MVNYAQFRRRLDEVLRQKDSLALQEFLIAEGQWTSESSGNLERRMWTMIAGSPALSALHPEAKAWLLANGYQEQVAAIFETEAGKKPAQKPTKPSPRDKRRGGPSSGKDPGTGSSPTTQEKGEHD